MQLKSQPEYIGIPSDFEPLPRYGHLSRKAPDYAAAEPAIDAAYAALWACPDFAAFHEAAGDCDAAMPPGGPDRSQLVIEYLDFPARDGAMIELKVYKSPHVNENATLLYRMHGGGWCVGRHEVDGVENVLAAMNPNIIVASVDFRRAPEHPFPQALHDSYDGLLWCQQNAKVLGVRPDSIILGGSSAGANLAAALALEARDAGVQCITAQVLHFPTVCHPKFFPHDKYEFGSCIQNRDNAVLTMSRWEAFLDAYIPRAEPDSRHSPLLAKSHQGLPPALIQCAGVDVLRDEAFAYGEALEAAGVEAETYGYSGLPHCFPLLLVSHEETARFYQRFSQFLKKHST